MKTLCLLLILISNVAGAVDIPESVVWICHSKSAMRSIKIEHTATRCSTIYTKDGQDQVMSRTADRNACELVGENIRGNLEKAHWACKAIEKTNFTTTSEIQ